MKKLLLCVLLCACTETPTSVTTLDKTEPGRVVNLMYVHSGHGSGTGVGISGGGNIVVTSNNVNIPARYGIVFECLHGSFAIEGRQDVWKRVKEGTCVEIFYRETRKTYKPPTPSVTEMEFLDARTAPCPEAKP